MLTGLAKPRRRSLQSLWRDASGLAFIEFAYALPIFLGFGLVGLEFTNVVLARQKTERIAATVADVIASNQVYPNERQIGDVFAAVPRIGEPFAFGENGNVVLTAVMGVYDEDSDTVQNKIAWQRCLREGGQPSAIGAEYGPTQTLSTADAVSLPGGIALGQNQMVVVAEVFFPYETVISQQLVGSVLPPDNMFRETAVFRTRGRALNSITPVEGVDKHAC